MEGHCVGTGWISGRTSRTRRAGSPASTAGGTPAATACPAPPSSVFLQDPPWPRSSLSSAWIRTAPSGSVYIDSFKPEQCKRNRSHQRAGRFAIETAQGTPWFRALLSLRSPVQRNASGSNQPCLPLAERLEGAAEEVLHVAFDLGLGNGPAGGGEVAVFLREDVGDDVPAVVPLRFRPGASP